MQEFLNKTPFFRYFVPLAIGIGVSLYFDLNASLHWLILGIYFLLTGVYFVLAYTKLKKANYIFAALLNCFFFFLGVESCYLRKAINQPDHYSRSLSEGDKVYIGYINDIPQEKEKTVKCKITLLSSYSGNNAEPVSGDLLAYVRKSETSQPLYFGDLLCFRASPQPIKEPLNPEEFNYKKYLSYKNIFHQVYLRSEDLVKEGKYTSNFVYDFSINLRVKLLNLLKDHKLTGDEYGVTAALLLGYDDTISGDLMSAYSHTGTLHVLSVSGLHIGMLYLVLNFLLRFPKRRSFVIAKTLIILAVLWFYAFLSGLSPSVVRSTIMFSFVLFGVLINKKGQIFNTIFASATLMLLFDPFLLIDAGFQLSYLAVAGIVFFYPYIYNWYLPANKITETLWKMFAVSISAQIITLPITLYYFHQFPLLFFVANLVVIPLSYAVMFGAVLIILFSKVKVIAGGIAWLVGKSAWLMNLFTEWLDTVEFSNISGIQTNALEMVLLFALIFAFTYAMLFKHYISFLLSLSLVIFLLCSSLYSVYESEKQERILVYGLHDHMGVQFIKGRSSLVLTDTLDNRSRQTIDNYSSATAVKKTTFTSLQKGVYTFTYEGQKWCALVGDTLDAYDPELLSCDYLLVSRSARLKGIETLDVSRIIVDGSNDYKTLAYLKKKLPAELAEKLWIVKEKGAYIIE
jgi:competence protein ComEC